MQSTLDTILESTLSTELGVPVNVGLASSMLDRHGLTRCEEEQFQQFESTARAESWLTGRAALKRVLAKCARDQDTSGILFPNREVSLSHSGDIAIAVFTDVANIGGIGIDVELTRTVRPEAAKFYLLDAEQCYINNLPEELRAGELLRLWTVKEAVFKADPNNTTTGLKDYRLSDPGAHCGYAAVGEQRNAQFKYSSVKLDFGVVSSAVKLVKQ